MKNKKICIGSIILLCFVLLGCLFYFFIIEKMDIRQGVSILKKSNVRYLESAFDQELLQYINIKDSELSVENITKSDLNNAYQDNKLIKRECYNYSGLIPIQQTEELPFGYSYRIPTILLKSGSNVLFCNPEGNEWKVEDECVKVTYFFDTIRKSDSKNVNKKDIDIGYRKNGSFVSCSTVHEANYYGEDSWCFQGDSFYLRITNMGTEDLILTNGIVTIVRDDTMMKVS